MRWRFDTQLTSDRHRRLITSAEEDKLVPHVSYIYYTFYLMPENLGVIMNAKLNKCKASNMSVCIGIQVFERDELVTLESKCAWPVLAFHISVLLCLNENY